MMVRARKICNACHDIVAEKLCLRYHTKKEYVTLRTDAPSTYVNYEDATTPGKIHYCRECWDKIVAKIEVQDY
jgi:hypothetical protein